MTKIMEERNYQYSATHFKDIQSIVNIMNLMPINFTTKMKWTNYTKDANYQNYFKKNRKSIYLHQ